MPFSAPFHSVFLWVLFEKLGVWAIELEIVDVEMVGKFMGARTCVSRWGKVRAAFGDGIQVVVILHVRGI